MHTTLTNTLTHAPMHKHIHTIYTTHIHTTLTSIHTHNALIHTHIHKYIPYMCIAPPNIHTRVACSFSLLLLCSGNGPCYWPFPASPESTDKTHIHTVVHFQLEFLVQMLGTTTSHLEKRVLIFNLSSTSPICPKHWWLVPSSS